MWTIPIATTFDHPVYWHREQMQVLHVTSQVLIVSVTLPFLELLCCVAHAPHTGSQGQQLQYWWTQLQELLQRYLHRRHLVLMIDANADPIPDDTHVGWYQHKSRPKQRFGDHLWTNIVQYFSLLLPSRYEQWHEGEGTTWISNDGLKQARDDYIAIPMTWSGFHLHSLVDMFLDSGTQGLDHRAVRLRIRGVLQGEVRPHRKATIDREAIRTATKDEWTHFFADWPSVPWDTDVTTHAASVRMEFQKRLQQHFPPKARKRNRPQAFSDKTWDLFQERNYLKKILAAHHRAVRHLHYNDAWYILTHKQYVPRPWISWCAYAMRISHTWCRLHECSTALKKSIQSDRADHIRVLVQDIAMADHKDVMRRLKPLRLGRRIACLGRKALPIVYLETGEVAATRQEATERWRRHFGEMEGGTLTTCQELLQRQPHHHSYPQTDIADLPTLCEVEHALRATKCGKATGHDGLPGDVLHVAAAEVAYMIGTLFLKQSLTRSESLQFKGGRLVTAYKRRGDPGLCSNHRALLVSSSLGKSFHTLYRKRVVPFLNSSASDLQFTAHHKPSISIAAHAVRLYQTWCHKRKRSSFYLFVDIREAFYRVLRQQAIDATFQDDHVTPFSFWMEMVVLFALSEELGRAMDSPTVPYTMRASSKVSHGMVLWAWKRAVEAYRCHKLSSHGLMTL